MKIEIKKIFAREFLLLLLSLGVGITTYLITYLYNYNQIKETIKIKLEISKYEVISDNLMNAFLKKKEKHEWFYRKNNEKVNLSRPIYNSPEELWAILDEYESKDLIVERYHNSWSMELKKILSEIGFDDPNELSYFIEKNRINREDKINFENGKKIQLKVRALENKLTHRKSKILNSLRQREIGLEAFCVAVALLFGVRYVYYSIVWSFNVLRED
jgi:hypothetical protein